MVETALVMPLYMLVLLGLLYFGYATLYRQRQVKAAAFAAWMPEIQSSEELLPYFWPGAVPQDLTLTAAEYASADDDYYGYGREIEPQYSLPSVGGDTFDRARITMDLWRVGQGRIRQVYDFGSGQPDIDYIPTVLSSYISAVVDTTSTPQEVHDYADGIALALNGPGAHWLERRHATLEAEYVPPFFPAIFNELGQAPSTLRVLVDRNYPATSYRPNSTVTMDLTGRGEGERLAAGEPGQTAEQLLLDVENAFGISLPAVD